MRIKSIIAEKDTVEFCYEGSSVKILVMDKELRIFEEIGYEVATGPIYSKIQLAVRGGNVYVISPFGENEVKDPSNILKGIMQLAELVKEKHKGLYEKIQRVIGTVPT
ncbi:MAG: hypothetical protein ASUL_03879 [Candidatus Aramenus sulfurataquae]|uniref:Uncharacterized protein n=1 Tax=Candidatus Aramenus sulfurataquae TaxID=1326980 RepID=W7KWI7_9CREN|nr:MAG: hypothetical protein ASUL_03879 [Candidatus Aramenus sulfurataquae]